MEGLALKHLCDVARSEEGVAEHVGCCLLLVHAHPGVSNGRHQPGFPRCKQPGLGEAVGSVEVGRVAPQGPEYGWFTGVEHGGEVRVPHVLTQGAVTRRSQLVYLTVAGVDYEIVSLVELVQGVVPVQVTLGELVGVIELHRPVKVTGRRIPHEHFTQESHVVSP